ncbi:hypothetical protein GS397_00665 [Sphingobium yanoikuyae]|uniref:Uncharacterized protein n=1 Tax=Sphingobium yanoikuyae TaxID=13690 RepID=A0A6P1GB48_SPHYA|nr:hypothetical protein [Sphingobium yanoikuyae]QHD65727.1 hypothetical protein GS397_00665 [Sphingobium yanoikuyae]
MADSELSLTRRGAVLGCVAATGASMMCGCGFADFRTARLRYRMTVDVKTPFGIRTGASVIETTLASGPRTGEGAGLSSGLQGEAVFVDLPNGHNLVALLSNAKFRSPADYHQNLFNDALRLGAVAIPPMPRILS